MNKRLQVCLTPEELLTLKRAAAGKPASTWAREELLKLATRRGKTP